MSPSLFDCFDIQRKERRKMPCTNCMAEYTRRRKEIGCAVCRFGFCERCVAQKVAVPSVSPTKPVPVCGNCYKMLTDPTQQQQQSSYSVGALKSRNLLPIGGAPFPQNAWGTDRLPPPSLRSLYNDAMAKGGKNGGDGKGGGQQRKAAEWDELETRLARLNDPNQFGEPQMAAAKLDKGPAKTTTTTAQANVGLANAPPIEELEERLAALRGVPVEVVRKPRLMVINDNDDDEGDSSREVPLSDEAAQLLQQVELGYAPHSSTSNSSSSANCAAGTTIKKQTMVDNGADDRCSVNSECPSSVLQNVIADALRAPSPSNLSTRTASDGEQLYPNFAECVRKTIEDAQAAEHEAMEFIRKYERQPDNLDQQSDQKDRHLTSDRRGHDDRC